MRPKQLVASRRSILTTRSTPPSPARPERRLYASSGNGRKLSLGWRSRNTFTSTNSKMKFDSGSARKRLASDIVEIVDSDNSNGDDESTILETSKTGFENKCRRKHWSRRYLTAISGRWFFFAISMLFHICYHRHLIYVISHYYRHRWHPSSYHICYHISLLAPCPLSYALIAIALISRHSSLATARHVVLTPTSPIHHRSSTVRVDSHCCLLLQPCWPFVESFSRGI